MATKYGRKAQSTVKKAMHEKKAGTLKSGGSGKKVTSKKQAIAIGLSEARKEGGKVPAKKGAAKKTAAKKSTGAKKTSAKKTSAKKTGAKRTAAKKSTAKKSTAKKST